MCICVCAANVMNEMLYMKLYAWNVIYEMLYKKYYITNVMYKCETQRCNSCLCIFLLKRWGNNLIDVYYVKTRNIIYKFEHVLL